MTVVEYDQTAEDLVALRTYFLSRMPERRRRKVAALAVSCLPALVVVGLGLSVLRSTLAASPAGPAFRLLGPLLFLAWLLSAAAAIPVYTAWALTPSGARWAVGRQLRRGGVPPTFLGRKRMAIGPDGLRASGDGFETFLAWKHVARVVTDLDHVFFLTLSTPKSIQGHAVPRGGFPTEFEFIEFARLAEGYWKAAHSAPAPQTRS